MPTVKFLQDYTVKDAEGRTYKKGRQYKMSAASAEHFVRRGVAIDPAAEKNDEKTEGNEVSEPGGQSGAPGESETGARGGDPVERFAQAQQDFAGKQLSQE